MNLEDTLLEIDAEAIIIDKPAGLPVDPPRDGGPSIAVLAEHLRFGFERVPVSAHRLDRDTSGCLLLARNPRALKKFQAAFAERAVEKIYLAIVVGTPGEADGTITLPLLKTSSKEAGWRIVADRRGQAADTRWALLASSGGHSLLRLTPGTGRTHQLRVHLATGLGCPIVGDPIYGSPDRGGMMLHAASLSIPRATKPPFIGRAPFPARFAALGFADPDAAGSLDG